MQYWEEYCEPHVRPRATVLVERFEGLILWPIAHPATMDYSQWACPVAVLHDDPPRVVGCQYDAPQYRLALAAFLDSLGTGSDG